MTELVRVVDATEHGRLQEIGELTALAYLADGLIDTAHPYVPQLRDAAARAQHAIVLALADGEHGDGRIHGTITLVPPGSSLAEFDTDDFELRMLAVSPIERGRGIGAKLTHAALELAVEKGARRVVLTTMETMIAAHRLYERVGFVRTPELDTRVVDNPDSPAGIALLGYAWESAH